MRLSVTDIQAISEAIGSAIGGAPAKLFLFGSRVDDKLKGGDIDLLVICEPPLRAHLEARKYAILAEIKGRIGDQKIDLVIATPPTPAGDPFVAHALQRAQLIKEWA